MGWSIGFDENWKRDIGYGVPCLCDDPSCSEEIDRGLSFVCGGEPYGGERGCGLYFCAKHLFMSARLPQLCRRCIRRRKPFAPKPDTAEWTNHKATDPSWAEWRKEHGWPEPVGKYRVLTPNGVLADGIWDRVEDIPERIPDRLYHYFSPEHDGEIIFVPAEPSAASEGESNGDPSKN